jgi:hypothetical protein
MSSAPFRLPCHPVGAVLWFVGAWDASSGVVVGYERRRDRPTALYGLRARDGHLHAVPAGLIFATRVFATRAVAIVRAFRDEVDGRQREPGQISGLQAVARMIELRSRSAAACEPWALLYARQWANLRLDEAEELARGRAA